MKNNMVKALMNKMAAKRIITLFLSITTALSLTACSLDFVGLDELRDEIVEITLDTAMESMYESFSETLEEADLSSEEGVQELADGLKSIAGATERIEDVEFVSATLVRVVDGDTIVIRLEGEEQKVRLIGINTPESVAPKGYRVENSDEGVEASEYVKHMLSDVKTVYLQRDTSDKDRYGRLLRYVWLELPDNPYDMQEVATKMLNGILVLEQVAEPAKYKPDTMYADIFEELSHEDYMDYE